MGKIPKEQQTRYREMIQTIFIHDKRVLQKSPYRRPNGFILPFIGDSVWVQVRYDEVKDYCRKKKLKWFTRTWQRKLARP